MFYRWSSDVDRAVYNAHLNNCLIYISSEKSFRNGYRLLIYTSLITRAFGPPTYYTGLLHKCQVAPLQLIKGVRYLKGTIIHDSLLDLNYLSALIKRSLGPRCWNICLPFLYIWFLRWALYSQLSSHITLPLEHINTRLLNMLATCSHNATHLF